ncbi:FAD-dependent oxidoreductase [Nocardioides xinjiangensis]|uniref:FAD-dependent oxidoreductase n=1 Tax=Nocardioides xinjiangensis TaxID=2817376 RepID=UPI001B311252|nr:FAD-dependent oxidoreductase [Nocardioides sp. SYSU D00778]
MKSNPTPARDRAVVIGASMAGLLAARVLADHYTEVILVDRDQLTGGHEPRRGVPQGRHIHSVLGRGDEILAELFPGIRDDFAAAGAASARIAGEVRFINAYGVLPRVEVTTPSICATRPLIEDVVRERVLADPAVELRDNTDAAGVMVDGGGRIRGVRLVARDDHRDLPLSADLVVDASGRSGRSVAWLDGLGHGRPPEDIVHSNMGYATRRYRLAGSTGRDQFIVVAARPDRPIGMAAGVVENDSWVVTLFGYGSHQPSGAEEDFLPQLEAIAPRDLFAAVLGGQPLGPVVTHRTPTSIRRNYQRMRTFPRGLIVFGDALCCFNPIYGQGITVAAQQSLVLRSWLESGSDDPRVFFRHAAPVVRGAWDIVSGADLSIPEVPGDRPLSVRVIGRYMSRLQAAAVGDPVVGHAYLRVLNLLDRPTALMRPAIAARVLRPGAAVRALAPTDPQPTAVGA